ncbi:hypothetical protein RFI_25071 [Reticulomyxa filosa]|uniref:Uncharacterized protein n=1 Tax=Reticulomyxa filosa TaxID=46433 RepID=X6MF69_RETFI|nr:hypothetical protein RFI_25071 [Reticulomyxa filosa]|eukprot:ETO12301.1 hypothetical protein RFI_25071 [Reticulomyxa filosa]
MFVIPLSYNPETEDVDLIEQRRKRPYTIGQRVTLKSEDGGCQEGIIRDYLLKERASQIWLENGEVTTLVLEKMDPSSWSYHTEGIHVWSLIDELVLLSQPTAVEKLMEWSPIPLAKQIGAIVECRRDVFKNSSEPPAESTAPQYCVGKITSFDPISRRSRVVYGTAATDASEWCWFVFFFVFFFCGNQSKLQYVFILWTRGTSNKIRELQMGKKEIKELIRKFAVVSVKEEHLPPTFDPTVYRLPSGFTLVSAPTHRYPTRFKKVSYYVTGANFFSFFSPFSNNTKIISFDQSYHDEYQQNNEFSGWDELEFCHYFFKKNCNFAGALALCANKYFFFTKKKKL